MMRSPHRSWMSTTLTVILAAAWFVLFAPVEMGGATSYIRVSGDSMEPTYETDDLVVLRERGTYDTGDIVAFRADGGVVIHRIIGGDGDEGFAMQGDNNDWIDRWTPSSDEILGEAWIHVPGGGGMLETARQPSSIGMAAGVVAGAGALTTRSRRRRRRHRFQRHATPSAETTVTPPPHDAAPTRPTGAERPSRRTDVDRPADLGGRGTLVSLAVVGALAVVVLCLSLVGWLSPTTGSETVERPVASHEMSFEYTVDVDDTSTLYDQATIGPITPGEDGGTGVPVYTMQASAIEVGYRYTIDPAGATGELRGERRVDLVITAEEGWTRTETLAVAEPFDGTTVSGDVTLDLADIGSTIATVENETGFEARSYELAVRPSVQVTDGDQLSDGAYSTSLTFRYTDVEITQEGDLLHREQQTVTEVVERDEHVGLGVIDVPVTALRWLLVPGFLLAALAAVLARRFGRSGEAELAVIRARYGSMLVSASRIDRSQSHRVHVGSVGDLARIAKNDAGVILHSQDDEGRHVFAVSDGPTSYEYVIRPRVER